MISTISWAILNSTEQKLPSRMLFLSPHDSLQLSKGLPWSLVWVKWTCRKTPYMSLYDAYSCPPVFFMEGRVLKVWTPYFSERDTVSKTFVLEKYCISLCSDTPQAYLGWYSFPRRLQALQCQGLLPGASWLVETMLCRKEIAN